MNPLSNEETQNNSKTVTTPLHEGGLFSQRGRSNRDDDKQGACSAAVVGPDPFASSPDYSSGAVRKDDRSAGNQQQYLTFYQAMGGPPSAGYCDDEKGCRYCLNGCC